jgi:hypothetical protein
MWCQDCRQDVPALPSADKQAFCCPRCGGEIRVASDPPADAPVAAIQLPGYDGWDLDEQLRHIQRLLQTAKGNEGGPKPMRLDPPQAGPPARHPDISDPSDVRPQAASVSRGSLSGFLTGLALSLGTTSFVCGSVLAGWSLAADRHDLWTLGLPLALGGQIMLVVGLVLQIDRLWHANRKAAAKLDNVDRQLHELKTTATLLGASQGPASTTFYSHFVAGASPQLLLTDLKSQLDLLAMKIARQEG